MLALFVLEQMEIVTDEASHHIPQTWVDRWNALKDYQEAHGNKMDWSYTSEDELRLWITLNQYMDEGRQKLDAWDKETYTLSSKLYSKFISASSIMRVLLFMNAVDGEYLLSVHIDEDLPSRWRKQLYKELGRYVRKNRLPFHYTSTYVERYGTYRMLGLYHDVANHDLMQLTKNAEAAEETWELALLFPYDILVGILHTAQQTQSGLLPMEVMEVDFDIAPRTEFLEEPPWWLVRWNDILTMYLTEETMAERDSAIATLETRLEQLTEEGKEDAIYGYLQMTIDTTQGDAEQVSDIVHIFMEVPLVRSLRLHAGVRQEEQTSSSDGLWQNIYYSISKEAFKSPPTFLWDSSKFLSVIAKQVSLVPTVRLFGLAVYVFGIDRLLVRDVSRTAEKTRDKVVLSRMVRGLSGLDEEDATCTAAVWLQHELNLQYGPTQVIPTSDYEMLMSRILAITNKDFVAGIVELCTRMEDEISSMYWTDEDVRALGEAAASVL